MDATGGGTPAAGPDAGTALGQISAAIQAANAPAGSGAPTSANQVLTALTLLRELRTQMAGWEPELIEAARALGASWADLAPALGVGGRQSAERRYLRLRSSLEGTAGTVEQRVAAERDRRAGDKAVAGWARDNAARLRQLAGQIGALTDLGSGAEADLDVLRTALGHDNVADLLGPLADTRPTSKAPTRIWPTRSRPWAAAPHRSGPTPTSAAGPRPNGNKPPTDR